MFIFRKLADEGKQQEENKIIYNVIIKKKFLNKEILVCLLFGTWLSSLTISWMLILLNVCCSEHLENLKAAFYLYVLWFIFSAPYVSHENSNNPIIFGGISLKQFRKAWRGKWKKRYLVSQPMLIFWWAPLQTFFFCMSTHI